jgi:hypothetical protein
MRFTERKNSWTAPAEDWNSTTTMVKLMRTRNEIRKEPARTIYLSYLFGRADGCRRWPKGTSVVNSAQYRISERVEELVERFGGVRGARGALIHAHA